jgi:hypothetical protein
MSSFCTQALVVHLDDLLKEGIVSLPNFLMKSMFCPCCLSSPLRIYRVVPES